MSDTTRFSEDVRPITELKKSASQIVAHACKSGRPVLLTKRGRGVAVLIELSEYEQLIEHKEFTQAVLEGHQQVELGKLHSHDEAKKILESFGSKP